MRPTFHSLLFITSVAVIIGMLILNILLVASHASSNGRFVISAIFAVLFGLLATKLFAPNPAGKLMVWQEYNADQKALFVLFTLLVQTTLLEVSVLVMLDHNLLEWDDLSHLSMDMPAAKFVLTLMAASTLFIPLILRYVLHPADE